MPSHVIYMLRRSTCKICGSIMPRRYPKSYMIWLLAGISISLLLLTPTLIGLSEIRGGLLIFIGILGIAVALLFFLRAGDKCEACKAADKRPK